MLPLLLTLGACERRAETQPAPAPPAVAARPAAVAGRFYPGSAAALQTSLQRYLDAAQPPNLPGQVVALIVPHAGYEFSAAVAAYAYKAVAGQRFDTVVVAGPSHHYNVPGAALSPDAAWETPLGSLPLDRALGDALIATDKGFLPSQPAHAEEHSAEVQVPFVQTVLPGSKLLPLAVGQISAAEAQRLGGVLARAVAGKSVLLIASTDLAHYPPADECAKLDRETLDALKSGDLSKLYARQAAVEAAGQENVACALCGLGAVALVLQAAHDLGATRIVELHYANSGQVNALTAGKSVGYGALACIRPAVAGQGSDQPVSADPETLSAEKRQWLLQLARRTIELFVKEGRRYEPQTTDPQLLAERACFVTLKSQGRLRGCIGHLEAREPLYLAVRNMAVAAASEDPRFRPVAADEVPQLHLEISVLSPMREVTSPDEIVVGKHGVVVKQGWQSGVFLPQVAPEQGWSRDEMLTHLCAEKAGLAPDAWRTGAKLSVFTAQVFGEPE